LQEFEQEYAKEEE